jgi:hypothetical protein
MAICDLPSKKISLRLRSTIYSRSGAEVVLSCQQK